MNQRAYVPDITEKSLPRTMDYSFKNIFIKRRGAFTNFVDILK
jgi:hypothetical protein